MTKEVNYDVNPVKPIEDTSGYPLLDRKLLRSKYVGDALPIYKNKNKKIFYIEYFRVLDMEVGDFIIIHKDDIDLFNCVRSALSKVLSEYSYIPEFAVKPDRNNTYRATRIR